MRRSNYYDYIRAVASFGVVVIHVAAAWMEAVPVTSPEWQTMHIYDSLVRCSVPLFFMVSGALFLDPQKHVTVKEIVTKYVLRLLIAYLVWSAFYAIVVIGALWNGSTDQILAAFLAGHYHLWFLPAMIGLYLVLPLLKKIAKHPDLLRYFLIVSVFVCVLLPVLRKVEYIQALTVYIDKFPLQYFQGYALYFVLGFWLSKQTEGFWVKKVSRNVLYGAGVISLAYLIGKTSYSSLQIGAPDFSLYDYFSVPVFILSIAVFTLFKNMKTEEKTQASVRKNQIVMLLSQRSFGIYLVHVFFIALLPRLGLSTLSFSPVFSVPLLSLGVYIVSLVTSHLLSKIKIVGKYIV